MSVEYRRLAAAQRAAASPSRRALVSWLFILPILLFFSSVVVAGAASGGRKPDYADAAKLLPRNAPLVVIAPASQEKSFLDRFRSAYVSHELCSVSQSQLAALAAHYPVRHVDVVIDGAHVDVVVVEGGNDHEVRAYLGDPKLKCKLVHAAHLFFLPFDAHTS